MYGPYFMLILTYVGDIKGNVSENQKVWYIAISMLEVKGSYRSRPC